MERKFPHLLSRGKLECAHRAPGFQARNAAETARAEEIARMVFRHAKIKAGRLLARRNVEQARLRAVGRAEPVGAAVQPGIHHGPLKRGRLTFEQDRPPAVIESLGPGLLREWRA